MTSMNMEFFEFLINEYVKKWNGTENDIKLLLSFRDSDNRKWRLIERMVRNQKFTKEFYCALRKRPYLPPTKRQLIAKKYKEVIFLYEHIFHSSPFINYSDERCLDYDLLLERATRAVQDFEKAYSDLLVLDPKTTIAQDIRMRYKN